VLSAAPPAAARAGAGAAASARSAARAAFRARAGAVRPTWRSPLNTLRLRPACAAPSRGSEQCFVWYRPQYAVNRAIAAGLAGRVSRPQGIGAHGIEAAYRLPVSLPSDQTVAVSIAFRTPHLARYLARYRSFYGLPPCTIASRCLRIVNQHGKASPLPVSGRGSGWDLEATLDVSMISAACPHCRILVVEANSPTYKALAETENTAARMGAQVISNSYGMRENGFAQKFARSYNHPGHTIVVATGDFGFTAAMFPANLETVTAVGGTELARAHNARGWKAKAWFAGGSGCSAYVAKPRWQHTVRDNHCPGRTVADLSAIAWNVPIYEKFYGGWVTLGGTSIAAPLIAGIYGLAGNASTIPLGYAYSHRANLFDIRRGSNSAFVSAKQACGDDYLCVAKKGYDGPTGLGTPDGIGAF
jgi:Subtilase family